MSRSQRRKNIDKLFRQMTEMSNCVWRRNVSFLEKHNITSAQMKILSVLDSGEEVTTSMIAKHSGHTLSAITQIIDPLVIEGYIIREQNSQDRRIIFLKLTVSGKKKNNEIKKEYVELVSKKMINISDHEIEIMLKIFEKLV
ncbi:MAG: MarR family winged helix-turn-helix transcriptional regulator [bacterium]